MPHLKTNMRLHTFPANVQVRQRSHCSFPFLIKQTQWTQSHGKSDCSIVTVILSQQRRMKSFSCIEICCQLSTRGIILVSVDQKPIPPTFNKGKYVNTFKLQVNQKGRHRGRHTWVGFDGRNSVKVNPVHSSTCLKQSSDHP